jgi:hypothetical protein
MGALRTERDVATSARLVNLDEATVRQQLAAGAAPAAAGAAGGDGYRFESSFWVFVQRDGKPVAQPVVAGLTDLDYSEVLSGLAPGDAVYILPSSALVENQQRFQQQMRNMMGMPGTQQRPGQERGADGAGRGAR